MIYRNIYVDVGKYILTPTAEHQLKEIAGSLLEKGAKSIQVSGHTNIQPFVGLPPEESDKRNLNLSQKRAVSIANASTKRGIPIRRMITKVLVTPSRQKVIQKQIGIKIGGW